VCRAGQKVPDGYYHLDRMIELAVLLRDLRGCRSADNVAVHPIASRPVTR
jgi:hypothetical protein